MTFRIRVSLLLLGCFAVLALLALLMLYIAARHVPGFYREAMEIPRGKLEKGSDRMLRQAAALESAANKEGPWEAIVTAEEINGWLAVDLEKNHPNALPPTIRDPRVAIDENGITVACRFEQDGTKSILSLTIAPSVPEPNVVALRIVRARAGLLPVPLGQVLDRVSEAAREMQLHLEWRRGGDDPVALLSLPNNEDGGRIMRIETLRLGDGEIYITGTTKRKEP
ncbi:MAG: hypothetical protein KKE86_14045 [Planctomycetes bacterium]|nr:hypothetical protein [Planctomycetota bacterium]MBU4400443.1 hypothetical protein [Planctomycetota bacterium]MCG2682823.1 hypothetical protein [Planctomycetales bacterium]